MIFRIYKLAVFSGLRYNQVNSIQFYSIFPKSYVEPVFKKEEQQKLYETSEGKNLTCIPIKPALNSDTCSIFHDTVKREFICYIMRHGKKQLARKLVEETFENIKILQLKKYYEAPPEEKEHIILDPKIILHQAIDNCAPILHLIKVMRGGIAYQIPTPLTEERSRFLSIKWLIESAKEKGSSFSHTLAKELVDAANKQGRSMKKKYDLHKQCEAHRAYAHYRWM